MFYTISCADLHNARTIALAHRAILQRALDVKKKNATSHEQKIRREQLSAYAMTNNVIAS